MHRRLLIHGLLAAFLMASGCQATNADEGSASGDEKVAVKLAIGSKLTLAACLASNVCTASLIATISGVIAVAADQEGILRDESIDVAERIGVAEGLIKKALEKEGRDWVESRLAPVLAQGGVPTGDALSEHGRVPTLLRAAASAAFLRVDKPTCMAATVYMRAPRGEEPRMRTTLAGVFFYPGNRAAGLLAYKAGAAVADHLARYYCVGMIDAVLGRHAVSLGLEHSCGVEQPQAVGNGVLPANWQHHCEAPPTAKIVAPPLDDSGSLHQYRPGGIPNPGPR